MDVEEEDGEVYEVDFSQTTDAQTSELQPEPIKAEENSSGAVPEKIELTPTSQSSTILASALTYHSKVTPIQTSTPSQVNTRSARRSTSSIGSASTQSISGENGGDGDSSRRKVPTRNNSYAKDETMGQTLFWALVLNEISLFVCIFQKQLTRSQRHERDSGQHLKRHWLQWQNLLVHWCSPVPTVPKRIMVKMRCRTTLMVYTSAKRLNTYAIIAEKCTLGGYPSTNISAQSIPTNQSLMSERRRLCLNVRGVCALNQTNHFVF